MGPQCGQGPDQLADMARETNYAAIALTKTWLTPSHEDAEVQICCNVPILHYSCGVVEVLALEARALEVILYVVYRPPDSTPQEIKLVWLSLRKPLSWPRPTSLNLLGLGDLNLPGIQWNSPQVTQSFSREAQLEARLIRFIDDQFQVQLVSTNLWPEYS
jgi:hypothetical protein